jgi:lipoprotein-anchoring transpeptidase ErfK/SrfK
MKSTFGNTISALVLLSCGLVISTTGWAEEPHPAMTIETLRAGVSALEQEAAALEEENRGLRQMVQSLDNDEVYLVVDTESNRLFIRQGEHVLQAIVVSTGSRELVKDENGRKWFFESPTGVLTVLGKERNPVWIRPDWSYVEENMPIPPKNDPDRIVRDVMGKYSLLLGNGYKIHGTTYKSLLGTAVTHGCVSMDDDDLETVYKSVSIGTKVYIY